MRAFDLEVLAAAVRADALYGRAGARTVDIADELDAGDGVHGWRVSPHRIARVLRRLQGQGFVLHTDRQSYLVRDVTGELVRMRSPGRGWRVTDEGRAAIVAKREEAA